MTTTFGDLGGGAATHRIDAKMPEKTRTISRLKGSMRWNQLYRRARKNGCCATLSPMKCRIVTVVCWLFPMLVIGQTHPKPTPPNVFLITIDTLRADHV